MATPNYFVASSIATDDTATFTDRETGSQDLAVTLTQEPDGSDDAVHQLALTVDLEVPQGVYLVVNVNGREYVATGMVP